MKKAFLLFLSCAVLHVATALAEEQEWSLRNQILGVKAKFTVRVVDENGKPVEGAKVWARFSQSSRGKFTVDEKFTGQDGCVTVSGRCDFYTRFVITKDGYYETSHTIEYDEDGYERKGGKWQPYGGMVQFKLKKIQKPTTMIQFSHFAFKVPLANQEYGFDMEYGALVEPYGPGKVADFFVTYTFSEDNGVFCKTMTISFPNCLDGAYPIDLDADSFLKSPYHADPDGNYIKTFTLKYAMRFKWEKNVHSGEITRIPAEAKPACDERVMKNQGLLLRTRTKVDAKGNLVGAHYGKIYGEIRLDDFFPGVPACGSNAMLFFNPVENDTNLECDSESFRNWLEAKKRGEPVGAGLYVL